MDIAISWGYLVFSSLLHRMEQCHCRDGSSSPRSDPETDLTLGVTCQDAGSLQRVFLGVKDRIRCKGNLRLGNLD